MGILQNELDVFHDQIKARALLIIIAWAGNQAALARRLNVTRGAVTKMIERGGGVSAAFAWALSRMPGCPLSATEMRPDVTDWGAYDRIATPLDCIHCRRKLSAPTVKAATARKIKRALKAAREAARPLADPPKRIGRPPTPRVAPQHDEKPKKPRKPAPPPFVSL